MEAKETKDTSHDSTASALTEPQSKQTKGQNQPAIQFDSRFITELAYQIRTLSNAIIGFSELLRYEDITERQTKYATEIYSAGQGVVSLVDEVQELSKIETGQVNIDTVDCSIAWLLDKIDSELRPCANEKGLEFQIFQCTHLPLNIRTDPARLSQCLINLTGNAIKFTGAGYVHLKVSLEDCDGESFVRFDVINSSTGILVNDQKNIFEPFAQIQDPNESILINVGLGLTITRHLVQLLGGKVSVARKPGEGSVFSLVIPTGVNIEPQPSLEQCKPLVSLSAKLDTTEYQQLTGHVLLAEDQPSNRTVMTLLLETMGTRVSVAENGLQAVQKAMAEPFDLILMDIKMPKMDGYEAARTLRKNQITTPIIALTASSPSEEQDKHMQNDFDGFLTKPVDSGKLYKAINRYIPALHALYSENE